MKGGFIIEPLGAHDRSAFSCGSPALDRYLREQASQDVKRLMASCFVVVETETNEIAGYYTLARLAVDQRFHRKGLGSTLLADAALRVLKGDTKAFALIVDAKDQNAVAFYRLQGFRPFADCPMSLFLPLGTVKKGAADENPS